jgi:hypothetical protein
VETWVYQHHISYYSSDILAPLRVGPAGSYPAGPTFSPALLATSQKGEIQKYIKPQEDHIILKDLSEGRTNVYIFFFLGGGECCTQ